MKELCDGSLTPRWEKIGKRVLNDFVGYVGERPKGIKRMRMTCPKCKRRLVASVRICEDAEWLIFNIPRHKPKHWWKKEKGKHVKGT